MLSALVDGGLCVGYIALNAGLNFANRWALGVHDFSFPLTLTAAHMLLNPVLLAPMMLLYEAYRSNHGKVLRGSWRALLVIAIFNGVQISLNNSSLVHIELSMNQVVRAAMPIIVAIFEFCRGTPPPSSHLPVLVAIAIGVMLVVYQSSGGGQGAGLDGQNGNASEWWGILLVVSSVSLQAAQMSFAGSLLSVKLDSFQMTFYTSPMAFLALAAPTTAVEGRAFRAYLHAKPAVAAAVTVGTCCLAVVYNVVMFQTIRRLGPIGSSVLGNVKIVVLLLLSFVLMGEMKHWTGRHYLGCLLTFGGAAVYSAQKLRRGGGKKGSQTAKAAAEKDK
mmetsp:Transcript_96423/g.241752  ORF Transcript_96423/g.241752 Transcript_96423/m.241752 type:complete len:333 (+) Transcript_96423:199-1197(+)